MDSRILKSEKVENKERKFGSALEYFPCKIILEDGSSVNALFTDNDIATGIERAERNPEDLEEDSSFWSYLFG